MFRRMVTRMGLTALAGLGLLLIGGLAKADTQGWPLQGRNTQGSSYQGRSYRDFQPFFVGEFLALWLRHVSALDPASRGLLRCRQHGGLLPYLGPLGIHETCRAY